MKNDVPMDGLNRVLDANNKIYRMLGGKLPFPLLGGGHPQLRLEVEPMPLERGTCIPMVELERVYKACPTHRRKHKPEQLKECLAKLSYRERFTRLLISINEEADRVSLVAAGDRVPGIENIHRRAMEVIRQAEDDGKLRLYHISANPAQAKRRVIASQKLVRIRSFIRRPVLRADELLSPTNENFFIAVICVPGNLDRAPEFKGIVVGWYGKEGVTAYIIDIFPLDHAIASYVNICGILDTAQGFDYPVLTMLEAAPQAEVVELPKPASPAVLEQPAPAEPPAPAEATEAPTEGDGEGSNVDPDVAQAEDALETPEDQESPGEILSDENGTDSIDDAELSPQREEQPVTA